MTDHKREAVKFMVIRPVCFNVVAAGLQVCLCRPAATKAQCPSVDTHLSESTTKLALERWRFG